MTEVIRTPMSYTNEELILESLRRIEDRLDELDMGTTVSGPEVQVQALTGTGYGSAFRLVRETLQKRQGGI